mgnify:CR=1 FL=1|tara:strand:+ start:1434 stop:1664 length:231 start_codon:yes stop_codon:yes gene_type:complete
MDFIKVAPHFPAWDVKDFNGTDIGCITNFEGEGFVATIEAEFTNNQPRTMKATLTETKEDFFAAVAGLVINLKNEG